MQGAIKIIESKAVEMQIEKNLESNLEGRNDFNVLNQITGRMKNSFQK